jgi:hypothetical protein
MSKINNAIVKAAEAQAVKDAVVSVISDFEEHVQKVLIEKILGVYETPEIKETSTIKPDATFVRYNPISDKVVYTFSRIDTRYFENQADADNFEAKGGFGGSSTQSETYAFKATHTSTCTDDCYLSRWNNN